MATSLSYSTDSSDSNRFSFKPLMLKDYLRDDLSSCSSNGFKSFPRRQCCSSVRFLLEIDRQNKQHYRPHYSTSAKQQPQRRQRQQITLRRSRSKAAASTTLSALHRASEAFISAVKLLHFPSSPAKSPSLSVQHGRGKKGILLSRSFPRRLFKKSFWKKPKDADKDDNNDNRRLRSFYELLKEKKGPSDESTQHSIMSTSAAVTESTSMSWSCCSERSNSKSWSSECDSSNDVVEVKSDQQNKESENVSDGVGVTVGEQDSVTQPTVKNPKEWQNEDEKEQFSPVSVLDCPFQDDEETASPFHPTLPGSKKKSVKKHRRFKSLAQLEPLDLEKRIAHSELVNRSHEKPSPSLSSVDTDENKQKQIGEAEELLNIVLSRMKSNTKLSRSETRLMIDFFNEKIEEVAVGVREREEEVKLVQDWIINGKPQEMFLGWEVKEGRQVHVKDMERNGKWRNLNEEEHEVALQMELEVFTSLVDEALDMF